MPSGGVHPINAARQHNPPPHIVIPPRASSIVNADAQIETIRDGYVRYIAERGRMAWQKANGYGRRSIVETTIGRYKHIIGPKVRARSTTAQKGEVAIAICALNQMIRIAKPNSIPAV